MSSATTGEDLEALFGEHGVVTSAKVIMDRETGNSKCFGFVEMEDETEGMNAINALNETEFQGRMIVVKKPVPEKKGIGMAVTVRSTETERIEVREDLIRIIDSGNCRKGTESHKALSFCIWLSGRHAGLCVTGQLPCVRLLTAREGG